MQQERSLHLIIVKVLVLFVSDDVRSAIRVYPDFTCIDLLGDPVDGLLAMLEFLSLPAYFPFERLQLFSLLLDLACICRGILLCFTFELELVFHFNFCPSPLTSCLENVHASSISRYTL